VQALWGEQQENGVSGTMTEFTSAFEVAVCSTGALGILEQLGLPALILDRHGRVVMLNAQASRFLRQSPDLRIEAERLQPVGRLAQRRLAVAIAEVLNASAPTREVIALRGSADDQVRFLMLTRCAPADGPDDALIVIINPWGTERACPSCISRLFELTPREAQLAARLAAGDGVQEAAQHLRMSVGTARTHLRHIFQKTGVETTAKLSLLLAACSFGPCERHGHNGSRTVKERQVASRAAPE
jgi:DNA-binding CsgD family transcriptional regulator